jgi:predicted signal transduction protein with EAL and GGDEF domain
MILVKDGQRAIEPAALAAECVSDWWLLPVETVRLAARLARLQEEVGAQNHAALHPTMALQGAAAGLLQGAQLLDLQETAWRLKADLRTGLAQHAFYYDFQPIFGAQTGELCGYEALLRWNCNGHVILPAKFLPLIAESGLLAEIQSALLAPIAQLLATADYGAGLAVRLCDRVELCRTRFGAGPRPGAHSHRDHRERGDAPAAARAGMPGVAQGLRLQDRTR